MSKASKAGLLAIVAGLAACSDNTMAPRAESPDTSTSVFGGGATEALTFYGTVHFSITIDPTRNTYFYVGAGNALNFPAKSLCDPARSSYGDGQWDKPCVVATAPVTVNVSAWMEDGHARVDFDPHLRFVPTSNPAGWVTLQFADLQASLDPFFNILYCPTSTSPCKNEALSDRSLLTVRNPLTGKISRRIKHFSGYNVAAGREDGGSEYSYSISPSDMKLNSVEQIQQAHPGLTSAAAAGMLRVIKAGKKSGYILASG